MLRAAPGYDATVVMPVAAETIVRVLDGPVAAADGSLWYGVAVSGEDGFLPGGSLAALAGSAEADETSDPGVSGAAQNDFSESQVEAAVVGERAIVTTALNLRSGPSTSDAVLLVMPAGASVTLTGNSANGFVSVDYNGTAGWAYQSYLDTGDTPSQPVPPSGASAVTTADLNVRSSASLSAPVILVMPAGSTVAITGSVQNGFYPVTYSGQAGWAFADYLTSGSSDDDGGSSGETGVARVTEALNLRTGPSTANGVITVMPAGTTITLTGNSANGFLSVSYNGTAGWAYAAYLETGGSSPSPDTPSNPDSGAGTGTGRTTTALNLRTGPSTSDGVLLVMPGGASVTLTGNSAN
ncbi:MAG TPA: SH3 domain-containing protein, partial [Thermomicrobiales bacterium]|nr:SH3 domain-containing protein [Thermomicrobiales bacterium]